MVDNGSASTELLEAICSAFNAHELDRITSFCQRLRVADAAQC